MNTLWLDEVTDYDGSQLRAHWIRRRTGLVGDALVAFRGACRVTEAEMADLEDLLDGPGIAGSDMVHFLWESFDDGHLPLALHRQRLLAAQALECLRQQSRRGDELRRVGDDLFLGEGKLSISVATCSPVSTLIHFAANVTNQGTPVPTASLRDLEVDPRGFALALLRSAAEEQASILRARALVRPKGESPQRPGTR